MVSFKSICGKLNSLSEQPLQTMKYLGQKLKLSWYPSSGKCFRDMLSWQTLQFFGFPAPDLLIHTDYCREINFEVGDTIFNDNETKVTITDKSSYSINNHQICYNWKSPHAESPACEWPEATFLEVQIECRRFGAFRKPVLFFHFENYNWFEQFVLRGDLKISHMFKLCEGCGFGGNRKSISSMYGLLGYMGCKYLLADQEIHFDEEMAEKLLRRIEYKQEFMNLENELYEILESDMRFEEHIELSRLQRPKQMRGNRITPLENPCSRIPPFEIKTIDRFYKYSGFETFIHEIKPLERNGNPDWHNMVLATISNGSHWYKEEWGPVF